MNGSSFQQHIKRIPRVYLLESEKYGRNEDVISFCVGGKSQYPSGRFYSSNALRNGEDGLRKATVRCPTESGDGKGNLLRPKKIQEGLRYRVTDGILHIKFDKDFGFQEVYDYLDLITESYHSDPYTILVDQEFV